ncbi:MAG: hypothetical protein V3V14_03715 [Saprospiraceae bacterium]
MPQTKNDIREKSIATVLLLSIVLLFANNANSTANTIIDVAPNAIELISLETLPLTPLVPQRDQDVVNIEDINPSIILTQTLQASPITRQDTLPHNSTTRSSVKTKMKMSTDNQDIEIEKENGKITKLIIDGKTIAPRDYDKHRSKIDGIHDEIYIEIDRDDAFDFGINSKNGDIFGMFFDGDEWQSFENDMEHMFSPEMIEKMEKMEFFSDGKNGHFDFQSLDKLKELAPMFEEMGIKLDTTMRKFGLGIFGDNEDFDWAESFDNFDFGDLDMEGFDFGNIDIEMLKKLQGHDGIEMFHFGDDDNGFGRRIERGHRTERGTVVDKIGQALNKDGLLSEYKSNEIELSGKHLKINGEKMPKALFNKYKRIYEDQTGAPLTKKSKIIFEIKGIPSKRKIRTF